MCIRYRYSTIKIRDVSKHCDQRVSIRGWVHRLRRSSKQLLFVTLRDGTGYLQTVLSGDVARCFDALRLTLESSVEIIGTVNADERADGGFELVCDYWKLIGLAPNDIEQIVNQDSGVDQRMKHRHLFVRGTKAALVMKLRSQILFLFRKHFYGKGYQEITPPTLVQTQVEGGSTLFNVDYYDQKAYLTQSSQLYLETTIPFLGDSFCIMPSYRAEKSFTKRHVTEFTHLEGERPFITFDELLETLEDQIVSVFEMIAADPALLADVKILNPDFKVPERPFLRLPYREAIEWLNERNVLKDDGTPFEFGDDIAEKQERFMIDTIGRPVMLMKFPKSLKPFYMPECEDDAECTQSVDLCVPGVGEIIGGSMRCWDEEELLKGYEREHIDPETYYWYIDQRRYGSCPHGGWGLGFERFLQYILKQEFIRDVCLYCRTPDRCQP
eukprot:TRINITY_DN2498_c0_g1_i2.p2 TRINITY_DN2498_c0_g1~~TRINITY_DN2498_c0_g1_i2.p2  ORF type:complete len:441 (+),score=137.51 TRINITY_DN2498_c0_g1_i2:72-1394(+)